MYGYPPKKAPKCGGDKVKCRLLPCRRGRLAGPEQVENGARKRGQRADDPIGAHFGDRPFGIAVIHGHDRHAGHELIEQRLFRRDAGTLDLNGGESNFYN